MGGHIEPHLLTYNFVATNQVMAKCLAGYHRSEALRSNGVLIGGSRWLQEINDDLSRISSSVFQVRRQFVVASRSR